MRSNVDLTLVFLLLSLGSVLGQNTGSGSQRLPQWLTGIIAVVGFLFLTFVVFLVKRAWCEKPKGNIVNVESAKPNDYVYAKNFQREEEEMNTYINSALDKNEETITAM
ncbi:hypothetical protein NL108_017247 [Boleophthalmus pectinirostris]|uniref:PDZK1-interacting protein 1 n=1 Tax=Boleophthalmus pectinirostris TaxID=150288 RepID=UPI002431EEDE|nr:PDZK1-interacting protein 1 [Boleophthalmus pectinirostris]KAJ0065714.1 hypothetical protein NL108_017247 [Boleophthalmus pectinirostris]